ncbi:MAG: hypothetical protein RLP15_02755 [Cryomorphaceae bacterium]
MMGARHIAPLLFSTLWSFNVCCAQEEKKYVYYEDSAIEYDEEKLNKQNFYRIASGTKRVFEWYQNNAGEAGNHSVAPTIIAFEVDPSLDQFELRATELLDANAVYIQDCRCQDKGIHPLKEGVIKGQRISQGLWRIEIDILVAGRNTTKVYHQEIRETFEQRER